MVYSTQEAFQCIRDITCNQGQSQSTEEEEIIDSIQRLFEVGQDLCANIHTKEIDILPHMIQLITHNKAYLQLHIQQTRVQLPTWIHSSFSIQFGQCVYGMLCISADANDPEQPALSPSFAKLLAQMCGLLLYTCEQTAIVQGQRQKRQYQVQGSLTKREYEVLTLMCRGWTGKEIAHTMGITAATVIKHKQRIYFHLGVHTEHDALIAAYQTGIFSVVKKTVALPSSS